MEQDPVDTRPQQPKQPQPQPLPGVEQQGAAITMDSKQVMDQVIKNIATGGSIDETMLWRCVELDPEVIKGIDSSDPPKRAYAKFDRKFKYYIIKTTYYS